MQVMWLVLLKQMLYFSLALLCYSRIYLWHSFLGSFSIKYYSSVVICTQRGFIRLATGQDVGLFDSANWSSGMNVESGLFNRNLTQDLKKMRGGKEGKKWKEMEYKLRRCTLWKWYIDREMVNLPKACISSGQSYENSSVVNYDSTAVP